MGEILNSGAGMAWAATVIRKEPWEVNPRLLELLTSREKLLLVRDVAVSSAADATPFHCANAPGTFAYQNGTYALRDALIGTHDWCLDRPDNVEAVRSETANILIAFANVDLACVDEHQPKPRSQKGSGSERTSQTSLFASLPQFAPIPNDRRALFYVMVDENGAVEFSRPIIKNKTFVNSIERNYLSDGGDEKPFSRMFDSGDPDHFDPQVIRKRA